MKNELKKYELKDNFVVIDVEHKKPHAGIGYGRFYITEDEILEIAENIKEKRKGNLCYKCKKSCKSETQIIGCTNFIQNEVKENGKTKENSTF